MGFIETVISWGASGLVAVGLFMLVLVVPMGYILITSWESKSFESLAAIATVTLMVTLMFVCIGVGLYFAELIGAYSILGIAAGFASFYFGIAGIGWLWEKSNTLRKNQNEQNT